MTDESGASAQASFIASPQQPILRRLVEYWTQKRGTRWAPARADIHPSEIKALLPDVMMWNVNATGERFTIRLVGENIVRFVGRNNTGASATFGMTEEAAAFMNSVLTLVVENRASLFRIGKAYWLQEKAYRDFEVSYLPLSSDGQTVDVILGGVKFDFIAPG